MNAILSGLKNWKTTLIGVVTSAAALASDAICDALGIVDAASQEHIKSGIIAIGVAVFALLSRDADVTSEQSGAK